MSQRIFIVIIALSLAAIGAMVVLRPRTEPPVMPLRPTRDSLIAKYGQPIAWAYTCDASMQKDGLELSIDGFELVDESDPLDIGLFYVFVGDEKVRSHFKSAADAGQTKIRSFPIANPSTSEIVCAKFREDGTSWDAKQFIPNQLKLRPMVIRHKAGP